MCPPLAACLTTCVAKQNHLILKCRKWFWTCVCTLLTCSQGFSAHVSCFDIHPFRLSKLPEVSLWMISTGKRRFHIIVQAIYDMNHLVLVSHRSIACRLKPRHFRFVFFYTLQYLRSNLGLSKPGHFNWGWLLRPHLAQRFCQLLNLSPRFSHNLRSVDGKNPMEKLKDDERHGQDGHV